MNSISLKITTTTPLSLCYSFKQHNLNPKNIQLKLNKQNKRKILLKTLKCFHNLNPKFSASTTDQTPTETPTEIVANKLQRLVSEFRSLTEPIERVKRLLHYAEILPPFNESARVQANRVTGCTTQVWLEVKMDDYGRMRFRADSDSEITKGFCSCLVWILDGADPEEVLSLKTEDLTEMNVGVHGKQKSRVNTWHNVLVAMQNRTKTLVDEREMELTPLEPFPSLVAKFFFPSESKIQELVDLLKDKQIDVVAYFNMDPEVQGLLTAAQKLWPHIYVSDSWVMAKAGCQYIAVLGVDFMSENVHAIILDQAGFGKDSRCTVDDPLGHEVVEAVKEIYSDSYLTAHFEGLGDVFSLVIEAKRRGMGVVGSTQNTLDFINQRVQEAVDRNLDDHLQFVLGTESGMFPSIVAAVNMLLTSFKSPTRTAKINIEIVFPVSSDLNSRTSGNLSNGLDSNETGNFINLFVVPGITSGEGCSIHGGRAYMKVNSLSLLIEVCHSLPDEKNIFSAFEAGRFNSHIPLGRPVAEIGSEPILHIRHFQSKQKKLPDKLVQ